VHLHLSCKVDKIPPRAVYRYRLIQVHTHEHTDGGTDGQTTRKQTPASL